MVIYQSSIYRVIATYDRQTVLLYRWHFKPTKLRDYEALEFCNKFDKLIKGDILGLTAFNMAIEKLIEDFR